MSAIPLQHAFQCFFANDETDTLNIDLTDKQYAVFETQNETVFIEDPEQVRMIRDMLTAWLTRSK